jgi:hypothetical protein
MNVATAIISVILLVVVVLIIRSLVVRSRRSSSGCGCGCDGCATGASDSARSGDGDLPDCCSTGSATNRLLEISLDNTPEVRDDTG